MAERVVLHIGLMKSGTSFVQRRLFGNQERLAERGIHVPGRWRLQVLAASDVLGRDKPKDAPGHWQWFLDEVAGHPGTVVLSMEFLAGADEEQVRRIAGDLAGTQVDIVVTLRDLGRNVPAMWQERVKNGGGIAWNDYLKSLKGSKSWAAGVFWRQQAFADIVERWAGVFGTDHVHVVTVPPPGAPSDLLWERFCEAASIDGAELIDTPTANTSLNASAARVLVELNRTVPDETDKRPFHRRVKFGLAKDALTRIPGDPIGFEAPRWMKKLTDDHIKRVEASGVRIVGDMDEMACRDVKGIDPGSLSDAEVAEAAVLTLRQLVLERVIDPRTLRLRDEADAEAQGGGSPAGDDDDDDMDDD